MADTVRELLEENLCFCSEYWRCPYCTAEDVGYCLIVRKGKEARTTTSKQGTVLIAIQDEA